MKAQASLEFMLNLVIWLAFLFLIITGLLTIANEINGQNSVLAKTATANEVSLRLEELQATGFTVYSPVAKHKLVGNEIVIDDNETEKTIAVKTIYDVEINGQPQ